MSNKDNYTVVHDLVIQKKIGELDQWENVTTGKLRMNDAIEKLYELSTFNKGETYRIGSREG